MKNKEKQRKLSRWKALLYKDLSDLRGNGQVLFIFMICVIVVSLSTYFLQGVIPASFILGFIMGMLTMIMQGNLVVEEQEQGTIRRLKQAGFSLKEIYFVKTLITFLTTGLIFMLFFMINEKGFLINFKILILILPILGIMLVAGAWLGMKTKNTIEVSLYGIPIIILYFFIEGLLMNSDKGDMPWLAIFPNYHLHYGISQIIQHGPFLLYLVAPSIWMVSVIIVFTYAFKKESTDNKKIYN